MNENLKRLINASKSCRSAGWIALAAGAVLLLSSDAQAQLSGARWRSGGGWGAGEPYCRHFDTNTVTTISGEVVKVGLLGSYRLCYLPPLPHGNVKLYFPKFKVL